MNSFRKFAPLGLIITIIAVLAIVGAFFLGIKVLKLTKENSDLKSARTLSSEQVKIVDFGGEFVEKVLKANKEVDFDTRLKLENNIREIGDKDILAQWQKFTDSKTEADAQNEVKNLLELFFEKLK
jgi:hypothetical protein